MDNEAGKTEAWMRKELGLKIGDPICPPPLSTAEKEILIAALMAESQEYDPGKEDHGRRAMNALICRALREGKPANAGDITCRVRDFRFFGDADARIVSLLLRVETNPFTPSAFD